MILESSPEALPSPLNVSTLSEKSATDRFLFRRTTYSSYQEKRHL